MNKAQRFIRENFGLLLLVLFSIFLMAVNVRINLFTYNNFDFGKFDLGNMTQMVWNTLHGRFMYLTDYFGTNVPRWAMSHVDPIILLVIPFFVIWETPLTLIYFQLFLVIFSSVIVYYVSYTVTRSKFASTCFGFVYLLYPAVGFLTAKTAYHGVTLAIPFFLLTFLVFEKMYTSRTFSVKGQVLFWVFAVITMSGKEQIPLYFVMYGLFILLFRNYNHFASDTEDKALVLKRYLTLVPVKIGLTVTLVGVLWFVMAFFIIIPGFAKLRSEGYDKFAGKIGINQETARNVALDNYFLSRYAEFGDSYLDILWGVTTDPQKVITIVFEGDKPTNFVQTFAPLGFVPFVYPQIFMMAIPDLMVNYLTGSDAGGISEIYNHRISMIVPVLVLSVIYFYLFLQKILAAKNGNATMLKFFNYSYPLFFVFLTLFTTAKYENPVYMWVTQAIQRRIPVFNVEAKTDPNILKNSKLEIGKTAKISSLENKDRECATEVVKFIPDRVSVSGPDYLGSALSMRETYAIFPALYDEADYVIVDVFARKIFTVLGLNSSLLKDIVKAMLRNPDYTFKMGCGNVLVYKREADVHKEMLLPIQERLEYKERVSYLIQEGMTVVDYEIPTKVSKGELAKAKFVYAKKASASYDNYVLFITIINRKTGQLYQQANLPSFGILEPQNWEKDKYYIESINFVIPDFIADGDAMFFIGATNTLKSTSTYLGDIEIR